MDKKRRLVFHGAGSEVGKSCIEVNYDKSRLLMDCGVKIGKERNEYPKVRNPSKISMVLLSHMHLDHTGALAWLCEQGFKGEIVCPEITKLVTDILLCDSLKIESRKFGQAMFKSSSIVKALSMMKDVQIGQSGEISFEMLTNGHIPGANSIDLQCGDKSVFYTGDISLVNTRLTSGSMDLSERDVLIIDCTYGDRNHPLRKETELQFKGIIDQVIAKGGSVLIPSFAIARTQEVMLLLYDLKPDYPIYLDGLGAEITDVFIRYSHLLKSKKLIDASRWIKRVNWQRRGEVKKQPGIFIASGGMLTGGASRAYLDKVVNDKNSAIILPGFQAEDTPGRMLLEFGKINSGREEVQVKCSYSNLDFSTHIDFAGIKKAIKLVNPDIVIAQHGEEKAIANVVKYTESIGKKAYAPKNNETINF